MDMKINTGAAQEPADAVAQSFLKSLTLLEQAHRRLHDVVKDDLERFVSVRRFD